MGRIAWRVAGLLGLAGVAVGWAAPPARAQAKFEAGLRGSYVPLYGGDATFGSVRGLGVSTQVALVFGKGGVSEVEAFYTLIPRHDLTPRIQLAGALLSLTRGIESRVTAVGSVGIGFMDGVEVDRTVRGSVLLSGR